MRRMILMVAAVALLGAECEAERLEKMDHGFLKMNGLTLSPMSLPCEVIGDGSIEHPDTFYECLEDLNEWFYPTDAVSGDIDEERFVAYELGSSEARYGTILVSVGSLPDLDWYEPGPGGVADLVWNDEGRILYADVVIDYEHAYDRQTFRDRLLHELGHACLALAHDDSSIDLGSCMASPAEYDCDFPPGDVERINVLE